MSESLNQALFHSYQSNKLGHFYLVEGLDIHDENKLSLWTEQILKKLFNLSPNRTLKNHPDLLWLSPQENKDYSVDDLDILNDFTKYKALEEKMKMVVIEKAHHLSVIVINKLLKILEDPEVPLCFWILNPECVELLPTLKSRAVVIKPFGINEKKSPTESIWPKEWQVTKPSFTDFLQWVKNEAHQNELFIQLMTEGIKTNNFHSAQSLLNWYKNDLLSQEIHQSIDSRWWMFYTEWKKLS